MNEANTNNSKLIKFVVISLALILIILIGIKFLQFRSLGKAVVAPPLTVSTYTVKKLEWEQTLSAIGSLEAAKGLIITADLSGRVAKINFDAGSEVKAGDLLVEQDTSTEKTQLRSAQAEAALAKSNLSRITELYQKKVVSKSQYDSAKSEYQTAVANVDNILSTIEKKSIRAPFDGSLGIRLVNLGQTINAGDPVVSLQATNQMFANFFLPQHFLSKVKVGLTVRIRTDAVPDKVFQGKVNAIDPEIDTSTRNIKLQAILSNPDNELLPGMFATIEVVMPEKEQVLLIPVTAVQYATYGDSVFVVERAATQDSIKENATNNNQHGEHSEAEHSETVDIKTEQLEAESPESNKSTEEQLITRQQFVKLGESRGDFISVLKGLEAGERVASVGVFKLRNKMPVVIDNTVVPDFQLSPAVDDK
jgi:membrane fusion protein (multidrug efflux system)